MGEIIIVKHPGKIRRLPLGPCVGRLNSAWTRMTPRWYPVFFLSISLSHSVEDGEIERGEREERRSKATGTQGGVLPW